MAIVGRECECVPLYGSPLRILKNCEFGEPNCVRGVSKRGRRTYRDGATTAMTCQDAIDILADFLDQALSADVGEALDAHLRGCEPCRAYLNTYRATRHLVGREGRVEMPPELKARLAEFLLGRLSSPGS